MPLIFFDEQARECCRCMLCEPSKKVKKFVLPMFHFHSQPICEGFNFLFFPPSLFLSLPPKNKTKIEKKHTVVMGLFVLVKDVITLILT